MRSLALILGVLGILLTGCNRHKSDEFKLPVHSEADVSANTKVQQSRIAGAFYDALVPKLKDCWSRVEGKGEVEFKLTYQKNGDKWEWQRAEVAKSDLSDKAKTAALDCMQSASRGSGFPANNNEALVPQKQFVIQWGWPVPFPENTSELAQMISTGPGGGNPECPKTCFDCLGTPGVPGTTKCVSTCSGYQTCVEDGSGDGCRLTPIGGQCATGWSGGWNGGFIAANRDRPRF
jgi:hypothetical protein